MVKINMGLKTVKTVGFLTAVALCAGTYFIGINPILKANEANDKEISENTAYIDSMAEKLIKYESGSDSEAVAKATQNVANFASLVPEDERVESSARAVAEALVPGVALNGFTFNPGQPVNPIAAIDQQLAGYSVLGEFSAVDAAAPAEDGTEEDALEDAGGDKENLAENTEAGAPAGVDSSGGGFQRFPFVISVTADDYSALSSYLENLANQPRLMNVVSVDVQGSGGLTAEIYAFAYSNVPE